MLDHEFKLKPSRLYITLSVVILLFSISILFLSPLSFLIKLISFIFLSLYGFRIFWKFGLMQDEHAILGFKHLTQNTFQVYTSHESYEASLCGDSIVTGFISVLRFQTVKYAWLKPSCVVLPDSLEPGVYRRLLIVLKLMSG